MAVSELAHIVAIAEHALDHYGPTAAAIMEARAREHTRHGELDGAVLWRHVGWAVRELQRLRRSR